MEDSMTVSADGYNLQVFRDEYAENPREWDNLGKMVCWHRRYNLGDKHDYESPQDFYESDEYKNALVILPVYLYDHSGITISNSDFGDRWDSGQIGYIFVTKGKAQEEYGLLNETTTELIRERLMSETKMYDQYLQGDCYAFRITDENGEEIDGCGGFFGDDISEVLRDMRDNVSIEFDGLFKKMEHHSSAYAAMM